MVLKFLHFLFIYPFFIFLVGLLGVVFNRRNIIVVLMSIELMLLAVNLNFIFFSIFLDDLWGQFFSLYVLTVAAAESAIGLAIFVLYFKDKKTIVLEGFTRGRN